MSRTQQARYERQLHSMVHRGRIAMREHPGALLEVGLPRDINLVATWSQALEAGLLHVNDAGRQVLDAMCKCYPAERAPTLNMVRVAWSAAKGGHHA